MTATSPPIILVGGCFDLIHYGHIFFLTEAKKIGGDLVVLLESDESVRTLKGDGRPFHTQQQRKMMLEAIRAVDRVIMLPPDMTEKMYRTITEELTPAYIAITDGDPIRDIKNDLARSVGAKLAVIPKTDTPSTTALAKLLNLE